MSASTVTRDRVDAAEGERDGTGEHRAKLGREAIQVKTSVRGFAHAFVTTSGRLTELGRLRPKYPQHLCDQPCLRDGCGLWQ